MKIFISSLVLILVFFLPACSRQVSGELPEEISEELEITEDIMEQETVEYFLAAAEDTVELPPPPAEPRFALSPERARPGEPMTVAYSGDSQGTMHASLYNAAGRRLARAVFFTLPREESEADIMAALLAVPNTAAAGAVTIRIESGENLIRELPFRIESREFNSMTIQLNQQNTEIRTAPNPERTRESEQLWAVLARTGTEIFDPGPFIFPVASSRRTSQYGDRRVYEYSDGGTGTTIHAGIDYGVVTGTPVMASGRGRVALAQFRIVTGYTVVLEHMPGLYSLYYHMDSLAVSSGQIVERGEFLGESGNTGLSTGPHLHWEFRVSTEYADPDAFLSRPVLDKSHLMNKLE